MQVTLHALDYVILVTYFAFILGIGWSLKRYVKGSTDSRNLKAGRVTPCAPLLGLSTTARTE